MPGMAHFVTTLLINQIFPQPELEVGIAAQHTTARPNHKQHLKGVSSSYIESDMSQYIFKVNKTCAIFHSGASAYLYSFPNQTLLFQPRRAKREWTWRYLYIIDSQLVFLRHNALEENVKGIRADIAFMISSIHKTNWKAQCGYN